METADYIEAVRNRSAAFLAAARTDIDAPVAHCPNWTLTDLTTHVGGVWGWAAATITTGARATFPSPPEGARGSGLIEWAEEQGQELQMALSTADPDANCWTFGLPRSRRFWFRRQALETAVHAWDAENAVGEPTSLEAGLASDGIDEFLTVMLPRFMERQAGEWDGESVHLHRTDGEGEWMVQLGPDGKVSSEQAHGKGDVALRGPASSLYLWCLNRMPADELEVFGDRSVADRWTSGITF